MQQYQKAMGISKKGDNTLLIWLGKQRLGQKENASETVVSEDVLKAFNELMQQLGNKQEETKASSLPECEQSMASPSSSNDCAMLSVFQ